MSEIEELHFGNPETTTDELFEIYGTNSMDTIADILYARRRRASYSVSDYCMDDEEDLFDSYNE